MTYLLAMERRDRARERYSSMDGDDLDAEYAKIQKKLEALRARMRATWNRFPHQTGWSPAIRRCEKIINAVKEAQGAQGV